MVQRGSLTARQATFSTKSPQLQQVSGVWRGFGEQFWESIKKTASEQKGFGQRVLETFWDSPDLVLIQDHPSSGNNGEKPGKLQQLWSNF